MDKTPVNTRTLEETLVDTILSGATAERSFVEAAISDFRTTFEEECFQAWDIAQAFKIDEDRNRFLDEKRVFKQQQDGFRAAVGAYNREREKEGKGEHVYTHSDLPTEPEPEARDDMQFGGGDCCGEDHDCEETHEA
jgi:hypothetical protein